MSVRYIHGAKGQNLLPASWLQVVATLDLLYPGWWKLDDPKGISTWNMAAAIQDLADDRNQLRVIMKDIVTYSTNEWARGVAQMALDATKREHDT